MKTMGMLAARLLLVLKRRRSLKLDLSRACLREGFVMPSGIHAKVEEGRCTIHHALGHGNAPLLDGDGLPHPLLVRVLRDIAMKVELHRIHDRLMSGMDGTEVRPAWTRLVHPVALRIVMEDLPDRAHGPYDWETMRSADARISDFHCDSTQQGTEEFTRIMLKRRDDRSKIDMVFTFLPREEDGVQRAQLAVATVVPHAAAAAAEGRRLGDLVEFAKTGHDDVDQAVADIIIERAEPQTVSTVLTLAPTRWIPWDAPPEGMKGWDSASPYIA